MNTLSPGAPSRSPRSRPRAKSPGRTLAPVFGGRGHDVVFHGYFACLVPLEPATGSAI